MVDGAGRPSRLAAVVAVAAVALLTPPAVGTPAAAADACSLVTEDEARLVVGAGTDDLAGPTSVRPGTCSWGATASTCTLRTLSVEVVRGDDAAARFAATRAAGGWTFADAGDEAFFRGEALPPGAAVMIQHLHLRRGDTTAVVTLVGRIGPGTGHDLLARTGRQVAARL